MIYVSSDWHGVPLDRILSLLREADFSNEDYLFVLGDVIDRGEHGVELLKWLMVQPNVQLLRGNHEDMLLKCEFLFREITERSTNELSADDMSAYHVWQRNGSAPTMNALSRETPASRDDILDYLRDLPLYDTVSVNGQDYVLVHAGLGNYDPNKRMEDYTAHDLLWTRPYLSARFSDNFITIIGHTPTGFYGPEYRGRILKTETWWDIDTGAAGGLSPMLLCLDDGKEYYVRTEDPT